MAVSRQNKKQIQELCRLFHLVFCFLLHLFPKTQFFFFFGSLVWLTLAQRLEGRAVRHLSTSVGLVRCELPQTPCGLLFQQHLYYVTAHYHVPSRVNVGDFNPDTSSRTLQSSQSAYFFKSSCSMSSIDSNLSVHQVLWPRGLSAQKGAWCNSWFFSKHQKSAVNMFKSPSPADVETRSFESSAVWFYFHTMQRHSDGMSSLKRKRSSFMPESL